MVNGCLLIFIGTWHCQINPLPLFGVSSLILALWGHDPMFVIVVNVPLYEVAKYGEKSLCMYSDYYLLL